MNPAEMNISLNELSHHGILGMKWGIRRFQKYPAGYSGDGKYVGPDGQPRQPTRKEARRDRKYNELKTKIDKWTRDAVANGDKKALKALKKTMTPQEYQEKYDTIVKTGVAKAVKAGDKEALKKFKNDLSPNEMKDARTMAAFTDAINRFDEKKINALISKVKNEDLKEAATRIAAMNDLQEKRISALKMESEASIKLAKVAKTAKDIGSIAKSAGDVYKFINDVKSGGSSDNNQNNQNQNQQQNNSQKSQSQKPQTQKPQQNNSQKPQTQTQKQNDSANSNKNQNETKKEAYASPSMIFEETPKSKPNNTKSNVLMEDVKKKTPVLMDDVKKRTVLMDDVIKASATNAIKENLDKVFSGEKEAPNYYYIGGRKVDMPKKKEIKHSFFSVIR